MNKIVTVLLVVSIAVLLFGGGYRFGEYRVNQKQSVSQATQSSNSVMDKVQRLLEEKYVDQTALVKQKMIYGAVKGMVAALNDPYTSFMTPSENTDAKKDLGGLYEGIGAQLGMKDNYIVIVSPLKGSPAGEAGVRPGDIILKVDKQETKGWALPQAVNAIRGPKNSTVTLTLARDGKEVVIPIKRRQITVEQVELKQKKDIAVLKVTQFGDQTNTMWDKYVAQIAQDFKNGKTKGLVLDLRSNPGGYLESAVYLASDFIPQGKRIVRQEYANKKGKDYVVERNGRLLEIPLVVLIDEGSASASEILTGALRDYNRAVLIGKKSYGKGSVQEAIDLENGTGLHVTVAKWILPSGDWINKKGIEPKITVENKIKEGNTITDETDSQLQRALQELR